MTMQLTGPICLSVANRGNPPQAFLGELLNWGRNADSWIFTPNDVPDDIYGWIKPILGPWESPLHRKAVMLEVMRVHAGFESSWNWNCGVDTTNRTSMAHIEGQETGIFQVSFDSTRLGENAMATFAKVHGVGSPQAFIDKMKSDHALAMEYYARLLRVSVRWAGPILRHEIDSSLSREAVAQFMILLG